MVEPTGSTTLSMATDPPTTEPATTVTPTTEPATTAGPTTDPSLVCGGSGWRRVVFLDMSNQNQNCPQGLTLTNYSIRSCGRPSNAPDYACSSATFPVDGQYSEVCGRATAYRFGINHAFYGTYNGLSTYGDGLTLTHGSSPTHIWSFISGWYSGTTSSDLFPNARCPCEPGNTYNPPLSVGNNYFCESVETAEFYYANRQAAEYEYLFYADNALWDGQEHLNTCYGNNNPPWFNKMLPAPTTDDINAHVCVYYDEQEGGIALQEMEIFVR